MTDFEQALVELVRRTVREELEAQSKPRSEPALLSVAAAAARIDMSESFIRGAIREGRLPARRFGRSVRVAPDDVDALTTRRPNATAESPRDRAARVVIGGRR